MNGPSGLGKMWRRGFNRFQQLTSRLTVLLLANNASFYSSREVPYLAQSSLAYVYKLQLGPS